jgi:hypothetical protein
LIVLPPVIASVGITELAKQANWEPQDSEQRGQSIMGIEISQRVQRSSQEYPRRDNVNDHRAGTSDHPLEVARKPRLRVDRIVIVQSMNPAKHVDAALRIIA